MNNSPLISVVIPAYNAGKYIEETLKSVSEQTYENWECIIVNDGSIDNTKDIIGKWINGKYKYRLISQQNSGVSSARNKGIENAKGNYIVFVDSDDTINPNYLSDFIDNLESEDTLIIQDFNRVHSDGSISPNYIKYTNSTYKLGEIEYSYHLFSGNPVNKLFSKNIIQNNHITFDKDLAYGEDEKFFLEYLSHISYIKTLNKANYNYFYRQNSAIERTYNYKTYINLLLCFNRFLESNLIINNKNKEIKKRYTLFFNLFINSLISKKLIHTTYIHILKQYHSIIRFENIEQKSIRFSIITLFYQFKFYRIFIYLWRKYY